MTAATTTRATVYQGRMVSTRAPNCPGSPYLPEHVATTGDSDRVGTVSRMGGLARQ
jgi:hypothetical protein